MDVADGTAIVTGGKGSVEANATVEITNTRTGETVRVAADDQGRFQAEIAAQSGDNLQVKAVDRAGNDSDVEEVQTVPPDPATVAPKVTPGVATNIYAATRFLYTGASPIQRGVNPDTIEPRRAAVIRGRVTDRQGEPLPGVEVTIKGHPEYGRTRTRADGKFDLAVNGGGTLTVSYERAGRLPAQRKVDVPWQDYAWAPDVALIEQAEKATLVDLNQDRLQVARGPGESDADGARQATVLFPAGVTAEMIMPDGSTEALNRLDFRATAYTVGERGPEAMPGELPATSGHTYAVELSVDQAREVRIMLHRDRFRPGAITPVTVPESAVTVP
ncbi:carboxypeptidase regulatory-like domain-containing protein [Thiohalorhabdus sp.]|uniref:carboxypeptidase regulatory-like domain-containing protein n=1 Tax=Thiohalorhabdus sp. TaxID=3094134 RepID=UPI002FC3DB60